MGNQQGKEENYKRKYKKNAQWNKATTAPPLPPSRPELVTNISSDNVTIRWERPKSDGGNSIQGYIVEHRRIGSQQWLRAVNMLIPNNELTISGLDPGWKYQFRVIAQNAVGISEPSDYSEPLTVMLHRKLTTSLPVFSTELKNTVVVEQSHVEFKTTYYGIPMPEIVWYKDGFELLNGERTKIFNDPESGYSTLLIENVFPSDEGEIKCSASNLTGTVHTIANLIVENPPKIMLPKNYEDGIIVEAEEILRLKITIEGRPSPTIIWTHNGSVIHSVGRNEIFTTEKSSSLRIVNVQRSDRGEYMVKALNKIGEDSKAFLVTVTSRPEPPGKAIITKCVGTSATLTFSEPRDDGGCKIGNYIIEYNRVGWDVWLKAASCRGLTTTLHDLFEGSEYKFRVKAENPYGVSDPGEESYLLFIPDVKRGILQPLRNVIPPSLNGTRNSSTRSSLLSIQEEKSNFRSLTPDNSVKVNSETSTRPESSIKLKLSNTVGVQFAANVYHNMSSNEILSTQTPSGKLPVEEGTKSVYEKTDELIGHTLTDKKYDSSLNPVKKVSIKLKDKQDMLLFEKSKLHQGSETIKNENMELKQDREQVKNKNKFDFEFEQTGAPPPPLSLSSPDLGVKIPLQLPIRSAASSTELLYEKAMAKFYQAVANEKALENDKLALNTKNVPIIHNKLQRCRSFSIGDKDQTFLQTKSEECSVLDEKRLLLNEESKTERNLTEKDKVLLSSSEMNDHNEDLCNIHTSCVISENEPVAKLSSDICSISNYSNEQLILRNNVKIDDEHDYHSDYTDSTVSSSDSIVDKMAKLKERLSLIESDGDDEIKTYHPRTMDLKTLTSPYKLPEHDQAVNVLNKPHPLPDPSFVPKPILKRPMSPVYISNNVTSSQIEFSNNKTHLARAVSPRIAETSNSTLRKPFSLKKNEIGGDIKKTTAEQKIISIDNSFEAEKFHQKTTSPLSEKKKLNMSYIEPKGELIVAKNTEPVSFENEQSKRFLLSDNLESDTTMIGVSNRPLISASNQRGRKLLQQRQNSEEENKTVIEHYTTILRDRDMIRSQKDKIPIYLNRNAIKEIHEKARKDGEAIDLEEDQNKVNISQGKRELDLNALTFVRRQRSSSLNRSSQSRDESLSRNSIKDQFSATIVLKSQTLPKSNKDTGVPSKNPILPKKRDTSLPTKYLQSNDSVIFKNQPFQPQSSDFFHRNTQDNKTKKCFNNQIDDMKLMQYPQSETSSQISKRSKTPFELKMEENVKSNISYVMDVCLLSFSFYLYVFKDAIFCIPILLLLIYRQLGDVLKNHTWPKKS